LDFAEDTTWIAARRASLFGASMSAETIEELADSSHQRKAKGANSDRTKTGEEGREDRW